jgi:E3 ubiquitin-protein ligase TRIP12
MASFLASIVSSGDNPTFVLCALQLIECLIVKLPQVYHASFHREGVVYEVEQLAAQEPQPKPPAVKVEPVEAASTAEEDAKPVIVMEPVKLKVPPTPADLHDANIHRARMLGAKRTFETEDGGDEAAVAMQRLEQLVAALVDEDADEAQHRETLRTIATLFQDADKALSSFELLKSGLVDGLLTFVTMDGKGESSTVPILTSVSQDSRRALLFEAFSAGPSGSPSPLTMLVKRLHESLSRLEVFEVETVKAGREGIFSS